VFECPKRISTAVLKVEDGVVHLVAEKLWESSAEIKPSGAQPRFSLTATSL
jgi:hypothetical protein